MWLNELQWNRSIDLRLAERRHQQLLLHITAPNCLVSEWWVGKEVKGLSLPVKYCPCICLGGLRKTMTILIKYSRLRDQNSTWVLPTTKHEHQLFRPEPELERIEDMNVVLGLTECLSTYLIDWVKAANKKWEERWPLRDSNPGLMTSRSVFRCPKQSVLTLSTVVFWDLPQKGRKQVPRFPYC